MVTTMRVAISGSSGMIGTALGEHLRARGHTVVPIVRRSDGAGTSSQASGEIAWDPTSGRIDADAFNGLDAVVHLAGAGIGDKRWTEGYKETLRRSRIDGTTLIAKTITESSPPLKVLISASGVNIYGDRGDEVLDERSSVAGSNDFLAALCVEWERCAQAAVAAGTRVVTIRSGAVLTPEGGALRKQLPLFKLGVGGQFGSGRQWQPWISLPDEVAAIEHLLTSELSGPVNLTAPHPVTNREFTKTLGAVLHRPAVIPIPKFGPSLLLGGELVESLLFHSMRVLPKALIDDGFVFQHPTLEGALRSLLDK